MRHARFNGGDILTVPFDNMPDIPEDNRGLHYWANPLWLSIEKKYLTEPRSSQSWNGKTKSKSKAVRKALSQPIVIIHPDGTIHKYRSRGNAGRAVGYGDGTGTGLRQAINKGETMRNGDIKIICFNREYVVVKVKA